MEFKALNIPSAATRYGFSDRRSGGLMARSMMLLELSLLLAATPTNANRAAYRSAIVDDNVLAKPTGSSRAKSERHLHELYGLDPNLTLFRLLRELASKENAALPLLALVCVFCRDAQLRASFPLIESLHPGEVLVRQRMEDWLEQAFPQRFSTAMRVSLAQNINTTWTVAGHLEGRAVKRRTLPKPLPAASVYAMLAGYLLGLRGETLLFSVFGHLVGADPKTLTDHLSIASRNGWLRFRHGGGVMEIDFSPLLSPQDEAWLHGPH